MTSGCRLTLFQVLLTALQLIIVSRAIERSDFCHSPQNGTIGERGIIRCSVTAGFIGVYWFDGRNERSPLIRYEGKTIYGHGPSSGDYNISTDGSLVINEVSMEQGGYYKIVVIDENYSDFEQEIQFNVFDRPTSTEIYSRYQHGEIGKKAIIKWNIPKGFEGVYWYDNIDDRDPIVRYEAGVKSGRLYNVEYDICDNGSLVIKNVTSKYNGYVFKLVVIDANYRDHVEEIHFSVTDDLQTTERTLTTVVITTASTMSSHPPQYSQSTETSLHTQNTTPLEKVQTSISSQASETRRLSTFTEDNIHSSTRTPRMTERSLTSPQSITLLAGNRTTSGSNRLLSCQYLQFFLVLYFVLFYM